MEMIKAKKKCKAFSLKAMKIAHFSKFMILQLHSSFTYFFTHEVMSDEVCRRMMNK